MSKLLEFILGSILITVFTVAFLFFSTLHYILRNGSIAACSWQGVAKTWIDSNADGRLDQGEPPLRDVEIHIADIDNRLVAVSWPAVTDHDGDVQIDVSIPGCAKAVFELYVDIPAGYRITTRPRIEVTPNVFESPNTQSVYYFGFVADR